MKKLLIVVDYQNDFVDGSLGFPKAKDLDPVIAKKIAEYRAGGDEVVFTCDTHGEDYLDTQEGKKLPISHCIRGGSGWELYGETGKAKGESLVFEKDVFGSAALFDWLRENEFDSIELCGLVLHICVISNAVIARTACPQAEIIVDAAAAASPDRETEQKAFDVLEGIQVKVLNR